MSPPPPMEESSTSVTPACPGNDIKNHHHHHRHRHRHRHRVSPSDAAKQDCPDRRQTEASSPLGRLQSTKPRRSHRRTCTRNSSKDRSRRRRRCRRKKHPKLEDLLVKQHDDPYYLRWNPTGDYDSGDEHWWKEMDTLEHDREATQRRADEAALYSEYKKHTNMVVHWGNATWIEHHGKHKCRETSTSATSLRALIQRLFDLARRGVPMPRSIRKNLECAVELREEFHRRVIQGTRGGREPDPEQATKRPKRLSRRKRSKGSEEPERNGDATGVMDAGIHKQVTHQWLLQQLKLLSGKFRVLPDDDDDDDDDDDNSSNNKKNNGKENAANRGATVQRPTLNSVRDTPEREHGCSSEPQTPSTTGSLFSKDAGSGSDDCCEKDETASSGASSSSSSSPSIGTYCDDDSSQSTGLSSSSLEEWDELFGDDGSVVSASENSRTKEETKDLKLRLALLTKPTTELGDDTKVAKDSMATNNEKEDSNDFEKQSKDNFDKDGNVNANANADANANANGNDNGNHNDNGNAVDPQKPLEIITHTITTSVVSSDGRLEVDSNHLRCAALCETKAEANPETKNALSLSTGIQHKNSKNPASPADNISAESPPSDRQHSNPRTKSLSNSKWKFNPRSNSVCFHRPVKVKQLPHAPLPGMSSLQLPLSTEGSQDCTPPRCGPAGRSSSDPPSNPLESGTVPLSTYCIHSGDAQEPIIISADSKQQNSTAQNAQQMLVQDETSKERNLEQHTRNPVSATRTTCTVANHKHDSGLVLRPASQEVPPSTNSSVWEFRSSKDSKDADVPWDEGAAPLAKERSFSFDSDPPEHWELLLPDENGDDDIIPQNDEIITASLLPMPILSSIQMQNKNKEVTGTLKPPKDSPKEGEVPPVLLPMLRKQYGSIWDMTSQGGEELPTMLRGSLGIPVQTNEASNEGPSLAKEETLPFHSDPPEHWELLLPDEDGTDDVAPEEDKTITALLLPMSIATSIQMQNKPTEEVTGPSKPSKEISKEGGISPVLLPSRSNLVQQYGSIWDMTSHGVEELTTMLRSSINTPVPTDEASSSGHHDPPEDWEMLCQDDHDCRNERGKENEESPMSAGEAEHILDGNPHKGFLSEELQQEQEKPIEASSVAMSTTFKTINNAILPGRDGAIRLLSRANKAPYNIVPNSDLDSVWDIFSNKEIPTVGSDYACGPPTSDLVRDELNLRNDRPEDDWESKYDS